MPYDFTKFLQAQENDYDEALQEIRAGHKRSHWIWYIFPQLQGLGHSAMAAYYAIHDLDEARAYLKHPVLRERLITISQALLSLPGRDPLDVMGYPDNLKLHSSMTLFHLAEPDCSVFQDVLDKYFKGEPDAYTVNHCREK